MSANNRQESVVFDRPTGDGTTTAPNGRRRRRTSKPVTLDDVAREAGVSPSTVSRVVSNSIPVSAKLRATVEGAINRLGYAPNRAARSLATSRSDSLAVVISESISQWMNDPFVGQLLFGIGERLAVTEFQLIMMLASTPRDQERVQRYVQGGHVDGLILVGSHASDPLPTQLVQRGVPLVFSGRPPAGIAAAYVDVDHRNGSRLAVNHLITGGRRCIATIHGTLDMPSSGDKLDGYRDALSAAGLPLDPTLEAAGNYNPTLAGQAMRNLLYHHPQIDGLFVASDTMAAAALGVIHATGRCVPEDIAVVGYDGTPVALATRPLLTTVRQPIEAMGNAMADLLLQRITAPDAPCSHMIFTTELIVRESSRAMRPGIDVASMAAGKT